MAKCEYLNVSQGNNSCVNLTNKYNNGTETNSDNITLFLDIYAMFVYVIFSLASTMNFLNIIALLNVPGKMTPHSKLIISLAISDICVLFPELFTRINRTISVFSGMYYCYFSVIFLYMEPCVILVSLLNLLTLGIDHYIAIVKPLHYNRIVTNRRISACIVLIWILSFVASVIETIPEIINYYKNNADQFPFCLHMILNYMPRFPHLLVIPELIVLIILYTRIYVAYKKHVTRRQYCRPDEQHNNKAIVTTLLIIITFMISWVPYTIIHILNFILTDTFYLNLPEDTIEKLWFISLMCKALILLNSLCDALIYALRLDTVKQGYKAVLAKLCKKNHICLRKE